MDPIIVAILLLTAAGLGLAVAVVVSVEKVGFLTAIKRLFAGPLGPK